MQDNDQQHNSPSSVRHYVGPQTRAIVAGMQWISSGFALFKRDIRMWIITIVVGVLIAISLQLVPVVGQLASMLLTYVWVGGLMIGCDEASKGKPFDVSYLFAGFKRCLPQLVQLSAIMGLATMVVFYITIGAEDLQTVATATQSGTVLSQEFAYGLMIKMLVAMLLMVPLFMAAWFAPALIILQNKSVMESMRLSVEGCVKNMLPFLLYGVVMLILYILAFIPYMLGLLVVMPVIIASIYTSYCDIYLSGEAQQDIMQMDA